MRCYYDDDVGMVHVTVLYDNNLTRYIHPDGYRDGVIGWESVVMARKAVIAVRISCDCVEQ